MSLVSDSQTAAGYLERLQAQLWEAGDHSRDDDIASIICMLDSPLFLQLLNLQESFQDLSHLSASQPLTEDAFDFSPSGELLLREEVSDNHTANDVSAASTLSLRPTYMGPGSAISTHSYNIEFQRSLERAAKGRQTETICLFKPENTSLGFSVVGLKDEEDEELGIYVQDIQPAGIAAKDGRLREGDQLLAIDGQPLDISHQEAIHILQSAQGPVEIVVARGPASKNPVSVAATQSPTSPTSSGDAFESQGVVGGEPGAEGVGEVGLEDGGQGQGDKSDMVLSADWTQLEVIDLINDGTGLGFGIIGGRSTGVVVKTILPGGVADLEGHLRSGDHILQIGDVNVRGMSSEQVALVLRQSGSHVRLIVARSIYEPPPFQIPNAPIIPTSQLDDHVAHINALMEQESRNVAAHAVMDDPSQQLHLHPHHSSVMEQVQVHPQPYELAGEVPEVEMFEVDLMKDTHGLGITIAGYVGGDNTPDEISGIYVKSISPGSAAAADGRIQVNDQIIEVDGQPLQGYTNHQAVEVLRNTGQMVHLRLARFRHGPKYEKLQQYLAQANQNSSAIPPTDTPAVSNPTYELDSRQVDVDDINVTAAEEDYSEELRPDVEAAIKTIWERIVGPDCEVVVAQLSKFKEGGGLGISLEGTVDVENGQEVRPHHYIGSIRPDGPVGLNGRLKTNDELLEVNGKRLLGLNHVSVVEILKYSPQHVRLVCARKKSPPQTEAFISQPASMNAAPCLPSATFVERMQMSSTGSERLIKAKSEQALSTTDSVPAAAALNKSKSRSLEPLTGLAMWSSEPVVIELEKGDRGLGFSILDYKDPMNPNETVIVIRSLVPGGVAQQDGRLVPGDRLMFVNAINLEQASLDEAAQALKGATKGIVRIGVAKPLPLSETPFRDENRFALFGAQTQLPSDPTPISSALVSELANSLQATQAANHYAAEDCVPDGTMASVAPVNLSSTSWDSSSSDTDHKGSSRGSTLQRKDSFYESDEEVKTPRYASPRKQKSEPEEPPPPYESAIEATSTTADNMTAPPIPPPPLREVHSHNVSCENAVQEDFSASLQTEVQLKTDLPSYEEAMLVGGEMDSLGDAPPVPPRAESQSDSVLSVEEEAAHLELEKTVTAELEFEQTTSVAMPPTPPTTADAKSQLPRPDTSGAGLSRPKPLGGVGGKKRGPPPPVPPKPRLAVRPLQQVTGRIGGHVFHHRKTSSQDSSASSSSDHATLAAAGGISMASDLKGVATPPSSPGLSPMGSPRTARPGLPSELEKCISLDKGNEQLGINVETVDKGINGCVIKSIIPGGAVHKDGRLQPGDYIVSINNESLRRITNAQARAILRRTSLLSSDINITYIPGTSVPPSGSLTPQSAQHSPSHTSMPSPNSIAAGQTVSSPSDSRNSSPAHVPSPLAATTTANSSTTTASVTSQPVSPRQKSLAADGSPAVGNHAWGPPRTVELERQKGKSLGISIVGGRVDMFNVSQEHTISGIFIKHVLDDSPAKANASLKTGDRILEVNGVDVRNATHDEAVEVIRNSSSPVRFMVQSLVDSTCPVDVEGAQLKPVQSFEEAPTNQTPEPITSQPVPSVAVAQPSFDGSQSIQGDAGTDSESEDEFGYTKKRLQRKYGDLGGQIEVIEFSRGKSSIGLCLAGNKDRSVMSVFVAGIQPDSPAARDGRIRVGDELLEINGSVLHGRSHLNASALVKSVTSSDVKLIINRRPDSLEKLAVKPISMGPSLSPETEAAKLITDKENKEEAGHPTSEVVQVITLQKQGTQGLGFGIMEETRDGRHGIYIRHITIGGAAAKDGQMAVGDELLEVGDESLLGQHCDKANEILRKTQGAVRLKIRKSGVTDNNAKALGSTDSIKLNNTTGSVPVESPPDESSTDPTEEQPPVDPLTCPVVPGKETYIEIEKGRTGLGLSIVGGSDTLLGAIIIHEVYADGAAARDGRLWAGDQILEVNKEDLREATHDRAIQILRQTPQCVGILVYRDDQQAREEDLYDVFTVELIKRPGKGLGLSIVGKKNDVGIYISDIVKGGVAEADGRLMQGDQILAVNGEDMRNATQEYAAGVLKTLMGKVSMTVGRLKAGSRTSSRKNSTGLKKSDSSASNRSKGKHSKSQSEDASHLRTVQLEHDLSGSLGISVAGGLGSPLGDVPIIIANLNPDGPAARSGKLRVGDKILMINGVSTDGMGHADAVQLLKASSPVTLQVVQGEDTVVSVTGGQRSRQVSGDQSGDPTLQTVAVELEDEGQPPQKTVTLERGPDGLGFSIVGGHGSPHGDLPIYVKNVFAKGAAAENGQLARGDQILSVNGQSLDGVTHEQAVNILKNSRGKVTLVILS
ncbi:multiple PDZ domain protein-like isoform X4 [Babylonia areolata]|uniref:multiple PDZ domain protein-like isoform X4 n=1 Tax=Babylonia areolata TaxID=304850 RepID=UPI003FD083E7